MSARLADRDRMLRLVTERQFQAQVEGILTAYGWRWFHAPANRPVNGRIQNVRAGWPDLFAIRGDRAIAVELKTETGRTTPDQDAWLAELAVTGVECYVWRPRDLETARRILA